MGIVTTRANALDTTVNLAQADVPSLYGWAELMAGHRVGAFLWDAGILGPEPGHPGCKVPPDILRKYGYAA